jgi:hypothetical protein
MKKIAAEHNAWAQSFSVLDVCKWLTDHPMLGVPVACKCAVVCHKAAGRPIAPKRHNQLDGASLLTELAGLRGKQYDGRHKSQSPGLQYTAHGIQSILGPRGLFSLMSHTLCPPGSRCRSALILTTA